MITVRRVRRAIRGTGYALLGLVAIGSAGRRATDAFSATRPLANRPDDVTPLGAHRFRVDGDPDVASGYVWGSAGPTALLVHGWGMDSSSMHSLVRPLRALGYRVAAFDAPAHGVSDGERATMTQFCRATGAVLDSLGDVRVIVAHSLGSIAAMSAVALRPESVPDCVTLVAPACTLAGVLERWARAETGLRGPVLARVYRELRARNGVPVGYWDVVGRGGGLDIPVLVVHDRDDSVVPFCDAEEIAAGLPRCDLVAVARRGHFGIVMAPEVGGVIGEFVARHGYER